MNRAAVEEEVEKEKEEEEEEEDEEYSDNFEDTRSPDDTQDPPRPSAPVFTQLFLFSKNLHSCYHLCMGKQKALFCF